MKKQILSIFLIFFFSFNCLSQNGINVSFSNPSNNQNFALNAPLGVTVDASDSDGRITNVRLFLDNTLIRQENGAPYEWGADNSNQADAGLQNLAQGSYTLKAIATDNSGASEETSISISVGTPTTTSGIAVSFSNPNNNQNFALNAPVGVTVDASDSNGNISNVRLFLDNTLIRQEGAAPYEWGADNSNSVDAALQNLAAGTYTLKAIATDNAGNTEETSILILIGGGTTPPATSGIAVSFSNPNNNQNFALNAPVGVTVDASDSNGNISNVRLFLDNTLIRQEGIAPYEWGADNSNSADAALQNLAAGTYTLKAIATDNEGNTEETSILILIGGGTTPPATSGIAVSFSNPNNNQNFALNAPVGVTVDASDSNGTISNVRLFLNNALIRQEGAAPYEWGADNSNQADAGLQNLAAGTYTLKAIATDNEGNTEETSILITISGGGTTPSVNLAFNFATAATNTPAGFIEDTGVAFGAKPNGSSYGWLLVSNNTPTNATAEARNRLPNPDFDPIRETLIHMNRGGGMPQLRWEVAVPNGTYQVTAQVGDANNEGTAATKHLLKAEGQTLIDYSPGVNGFGTRTVAQNITVNDGRLTLDAVDGVNTKINSVAVQSIDGQRFPAVVGSVPLDGATNVNLNTSISANFLFLPNNSAAGATSLDNSTINTNTVKLFKITGTTATPVNVSVNGTGGGDAINLSVPSSTLDANSRYRFSVNGVKDLAGVTIFPYTSEFTTGTTAGTGTNPGGSNLDDVSFTKTGNVAGGAYASLAVGPDGKLYGLQISGTIDRWNINADGTLSGKQELSGLTNAYGGNRLSVGLTFAPNSTAGNLVAYVTHSTFVFTNGPEWDGKLSRLSGANLQNEQLILTELPRSIRDHLTNSIAFDPNNNNVLYFNQGANNAGGAPDGAWGFRDERLLSAATLRLDLSKLPNNLPLNVRTSENQSVINNASTNSATLSDGTYNPYFSNAPLTIYASGVRNAYDLVWHSNGQLYIPTNGTGGGSNSPGSVNGTRRTNGGSYNGPSIPAINNNSTQRDFLYRVNPNSSGGYYGHPNPKRGEYVLNRGSIDEGNYPGNITPDANYRGFAFDFEFNKSPNGVIEYKSAGPLQGALIVTRFSGGSDLIALVPNGTNGDIGASKIGINGFTGFGDPLDLVEDTNTGNIYVSDFSTNQIVLIKPGTGVVNPPATGSGITVAFGSPANNQNFAENAPVGVVVNASDSNGAINNVRLFLNNTLIRQENGAPYEWGAANAGSADPGLQNLAAGTYTLKAIATDNEGNTVETSIVITIGNVVTPPSNNNGITISFASPENSDVIGTGEQLGVVVSATDSDGTISNVRLFLDNNFIRQEGAAPYEWGAANTNSADAGLQNLAVGTYTLRAVATDNDGNTAESFINFSIINTTGGGNTGNNGNITVKNLRLIPGTDRAFPYDDRVIFHQVQNNSEAGFLSSEYGEVQIANTGNQTILVSSVNITSNEFNIISGGGAFTLAPGATRDVLIRFVTNAGDKRIVEAELQVNSNDANTPQVSVTLAGGYMRQTQGAEEFTAKELIDLYGFSTKLTGDGLLLDSEYPTAAQVASGVKGDIVVSRFWEQADPNQPVSAIYTNVFKFTGGSEARLINASNQLVDGFRFSYRGEWAQTLFPNQSTDPASVPVSQFSGNVSEPFAIQINGRTTLGANGTAANGDPNDLSVRVYKVIEQDGTVRPNEYLAIMDFIPGEGCVENGLGSCDYNDNGIFITNIKPLGENWCRNVTSGGTITGDETICNNTDAGPITSSSFPSGGTGTVEYLWLSSTTGCPNSLNNTIPDANNSTYDPGVLSETTFFRRLSRRAGCSDWFEGESNCIRKNVETCNSTTTNTTPTGCGASYTVSGLEITFNNTSAPIGVFKVLDSSFNTIFSCNPFETPCNNVESVRVPSAGSYFVQLQTYQDFSNPICNEFELVTVGNGAARSKVLNPETAASKSLLNVDNQLFKPTVSLYPNPAMESVKVELRDFQNTDVEIRLVSQLGKTLKTIALQSVDKTRHEVNLAGITNGIYTIIIFAEGQAPISKKLIVRRGF